jgi:hypothetical protein
MTMHIKLWQQHWNVSIPKYLTPWRDSNPGSCVLQADAMTTIPRRQGNSQRICFFETEIFARVFYFFWPQGKFANFPRRKPNIKCRNRPIPLAFKDRSERGEAICPTCICRCLWPCRRVHKAGGQCYDHSFRRFLPIFGKQIVVVPENQWHDLFLHKITVLWLLNNGKMLTKFFFKYHNNGSGPKKELNSPRWPKYIPWTDIVNYRH